MYAHKILGMSTPLPINPSQSTALARHDHTAGLGRTKYTYDYAEPDNNLFGGRVGRTRDNRDEAEEKPRSNQIYSPNWNN